MGQSLVFTGDVERVLKEYEYKVGYITTVKGSGHHTLIKYWYKDNCVLYTSHSNGFVEFVCSCNTLMKIRTYGSTSEEFIQKLSELLNRSFVSIPPVPAIFTDIVFDKNDEKQKQIRKFTQASTTFKTEFLEVLKSSINAFCGRMIESLVPRQFQFYKSGFDASVHYVSEIAENCAIMETYTRGGAVTSVSTFESLITEYAQIQMPSGLSDVISSILNIMHEIVNSTEVVNCVKRCGYKPYSNTEIVRSTVNLTGVSDIPTRNSDFGKEIYISKDMYNFRVGNDGECYISFGTERVDVSSCKSIFDFVSTSDFVEYARTFITSFVHKCNFWLSTHEDVREHLCYLVAMLENLEVDESGGRTMAKHVDNINDYVLGLVKAGAQVQSAKKSATVVARPGVIGEIVTTEIDKTENKVQVDEKTGRPGWVVTNPGGESYIVKDSVFTDIYEATGNKPDEYRKKAIQLLVYCDETVEFTPSWGGSFSVEKGGYFTVNGYNDIAGVQKDAYEQTYQVISSSDADREKAIRILTNTFNKEEYLKDYVGMLPAASVAECKTKEDCDTLLNRLGVK